MAGPILFYMDFASPYAYFASAEIDDIGAAYGRTVEWRPILMWAVLKAHNIAPPMDVPAKRAYLLHDMERSAAFLGLPYAAPTKLPISAHLAARLYYAIREKDARAAAALAKHLLSAFFSERLDISDEATLIALGSRIDLSPDEVIEGARGPIGRALLEQAVADAIKADVVGSPYFLVDGEGFFGADRIPQLKWFLSGGKP